MKSNLKKLSIHAYLPLFLLSLIIILATGGQLQAKSTNQQWSKTSPEINLSHIFEGVINSRGKPTGFHSRFNSKDPKNARLIRTKARANKSGVYTATVEIYDPRSKQWKEKFSTMFPDSMNRDQVIDAILHAFKNRTTKNKTKWEGPSGKGFTIQGYLNKRSNINTAYPLYKR